MPTKDIGLVLCGRGGKGAFQIGAWKALDEHGLLSRVGEISGTSVGGLNAVLFALGDYKNAKRIWSQVTPQKMLKPSKEILKFIASVPVNLLAGGLAGASPEAAAAQIAASFKHSEIDGLFTREELVNLIKENISVENIKTSGPTVFVTMQRKIGEIDYQELNKLESEDEIINALLATSSLPVIYSPQEIQGKKMRDGGLTQFGNVPVQPLYDRGCRRIIIISMNNRFNMEVVKASSDRKINLYDMYHGCEFTVIKPSKSFGSIKGTLDFRQESIREKMDLGYLDANDILVLGGY